VSGANRPRVYLAHGKTDERAAAQLANGLLGHGVRVWLAEWDVALGEVIVAKHEAAIADADVSLVLFSRRGLDDAWMRQLYAAMLTEALGREGG
jgi:hypothetical protein